MEVTIDARVVPTIGRHEGIPSAAYHSWDAFNSSKLSLIIRSPAHLRASMDFPEEATPAMTFGDAIHYAVLQPELLDEFYCGEKPTKPTGKMFDRRYKEGKENYAQWQDQVLDPWSAENAGKTELPQSEYNRLPNIRLACERTPAARYVLGLGKHESSFVWVDPTTGILCRCRPDVTGEDRNLLVDLKSTRDARPEAFSKAIANFGYHRQAAWYMDGVNAVLGPGTITDFAFVPVEKTPPFGVGVYVLDPSDVERGRTQNQAALKLYAECRERDVWPGYGAEVIPIGLPFWTRNRIDQGAA